MLFKNFILIAVVCSSARATFENLPAAHKVCKEKYQITDEIFVKHDTEGGPYDDIDITLKDETNEDHRCYIECLMKEFGAINDGAVDLDVMIALAEKELEDNKAEIDADTLKAEVESCTTTAGDGQCMNSYHIAKCLFDMIRKHLQT